MTEQDSSVSFISKEEQEALEVISRKVEADIRLAGLPVNYQGNYNQNPRPKEPGVRVFYDPVADGGAGVYVSWRVSSGLMRSAALEGIGSRPVHVGGSWLAIMLDALQQLLGAAGWEVDAVNTGVHESSLRIVGSPESFLSDSAVDGLA